MAMLGNSDLQTILDKLARFASEAVGDPEFNAGFNAGFSLANTDVWSAMATFILALNDIDQVSDLLPPARDLSEVPPSPPTSFLLTVPSINKMIAALDTHYKNFGYTGVNARLTAVNASTPTLRAHGFFKRYFGKITAPNSFIPADLVLATFAITGATTGTFAHSTAIDKTLYAGAKLVIKNNGALSGTTGVTVTATKLDGTSAALTASVSVTTDGHETNLSDTAMLYTDVTNVAVTGGTNADAIKIVAKTDRDISAA